MLGKMDRMSPGQLRRLMSQRSIRAYLERRRNERHAVGSRLDFAWLDQDRSNLVTRLEKITLTS
jgi:hypothetical protein